MTKYKEGDKVVVTISRIDAQGYLRIMNRSGVGWIGITPEMVEHLPPSLTPEAQEVVEAARIWARSKIGNAGALLAACDAYEVAIAAPDPIAKLITAAKVILQAYGDDALPHLAKAVEAAERSRPK